MTTSRVEKARDAAKAGEWREAFEQFGAAARERELEPEDLDRYGLVAHLVGDVETGDAVRALAFQGFLDRGLDTRAARVAFWIGMSANVRGDTAQAAGWFARSERLVEAHPDCVERGYLLLPGAIARVAGDDPAGAIPLFEEALGVAERCGEADLRTLACMGMGHGRIALGDVAGGVRLLDEAMLAVTAELVSPLVAGITYCAVIAACQDICDVRRAGEWTAALTRWCESNEGMVPFRGQCLVHRAEIMQLSGDWPQARRIIDDATTLFATSRAQALAGDAHYRRGELARLRGDQAAAEEAYRLASQVGRSPHPGLALLRLAQGKADAADAAIRRVLEETSKPVERARIIPAFVEIILSRDDVASARAAADELARLAADIDVTLMRALAAQTAGAVHLAEGNAKAALASLREAWTGWQELAAPYEGARARVLIGTAYRALGDDDGAEMELDAARWVFRQLGAAPDLAAVEALSRPPTGTPGGLTGREVEVLRLLAAGKTNRAIAEELVISQKTVARHVSNIFTKLGLSSRSAATAYAYEHDLT